jgi:membrane-associated protease RseP (regulator of RpoE activity)
MLMFQVPPPTRYDLNFSISGIPVRVHPFFWLISLLLGSSSNSLLGAVIWVIAVFISILVHELGHALVMRRYGQDPEIILHFGGLAVPRSISWGGGYANVGTTPTQQIIISLAGPFAGFAFAILILLISTVLGGVIIPNFILGFLPFPTVAFPGSSTLLASTIMIFLLINIFWGYINLVPVYPLDGGQVARYAWLKADPWDGVRKSLWLSVIAGAVMAVAALLVFRSIYMTVLFGFLAFQSYQTVSGRSMY